MLSEFHELRGLGDHQGRVYVWPAASVDHVTAAAILGISYDPATDDHNGKAFYIRSMEDWLDRKRPPISEKRIRLSCSSTSGIRLRNGAANLLGSVVMMVKVSLVSDLSMNSRYGHESNCARSYLAPAWLCDGIASQCKYHADPVGFDK
jgi:hypothetical protein